MVSRTIPSWVVNLYFDHAATTPPRPEARRALGRWLDAANASGVHTDAREARTAVEHAREQVAASIGATPHEIVFTSGGTEADNLAVKGVVWAATQHVHGVPHVVTTAIEHAAVLEPLNWMAQRHQITLTVVASQPDGIVDVDRVMAAVRDDTVLVAVMAANNEIGSVNDVAGIARALADHPAVVHSDAVQMAATRPIDVAALGVDSLALSAHKFGGPQGVGIAYLRRGMAIDPLLHGGGQDRGVRSGTFATGLIAACGQALATASTEQPTLDRRLRGYAQRLHDELTALPGVTRTGPVADQDRLASHTHLLLDGVDPDALALALDGARLAASGGAACTSGAAKASHVLAAIGAQGSPLRLTTGWTTTDAEVDRAVDVLLDLLPKLRGRTRSAAQALTTLTRIS